MMALVMLFTPVQALSGSSVLAEKTVYADEQEALVGDNGLESTDNSIQAAAVTGLDIMGAEIDKDGYMQTGWQKISGQWYYFNTSGAMQTGWYKEGSVYYYLKSDGAMAADEWVDEGKYYIDSNGHWKE